MSSGIFIEKPAICMHWELAVRQNCHFQEIGDSKDSRDAFGLLSSDLLCNEENFTKSQPRIQLEQNMAC